MNCPVCKRELAPTLSICFTCGAMVNDTVREELKTKIAPVAAHSGNLPSKKLPTPVPQIPTPVVLEELPKSAPIVHTPLKQIQGAPVPAPAERLLPSKPPKAGYETSDLHSKKTSPTLVGFQTKKAALPDWRLQLQNSIRQRSNGSQRETLTDATPKAYQKQIVTNGANALKMEFVEESKQVEHSNPHVAKALKRIEDSRKTFLAPKEEPEAEKPTVNKNYPFNVVSRSPQTPANRPEASIAVNTAPKPKLVSSLRIEKKAFDTNKLPPLPKPAEIATSFGITVDSGSLTQKTDDEIAQKRVVIDKDVLESEAVEVMAEGSGEIDDLAPLAMRFNAGLFDLIIGGFGSLVLLSPFMLTGGSWLTVSGILAFAATAAIVMFLYLTISIGFFSRTVGMRLFSLELVDADENAYPTLHQAAVHSSVFIVSLASGGLGFLPMFFNEERRAAHDLVSGTILLREY